VVQPALAKQLLENRQAIFGYIFALTRDLGAAEEVFQEVALAILEEASSGMEVERFMPWAREVARRRVAKFHRELSKRRRFEPLAGPMIEVISRAFDENPEPAALAQHRMAHLRECMKRLPDRARELIQRRYGDRLGISDIAAAIAWKADSVKVALSRARKALADCIGMKMRSSEGGTT
jgi:RNA polymerase sigma-70 factor (ECF subfamily)